MRVGLRLLASAYTLQLLSAFIYFRLNIGNVVLMFSFKISDKIFNKFGKMKCAVVILICFNYAFLLCDCRMSGLYIDNGVDQTIVQRFMTRQEKREVEHEILNLLGLQFRPRPANSKTLGSSAPKFLLDVYKSLLDSPNSRSTRSEFNLSGRDLHAIDESDVIMTFTSNSKLMVTLLLLPPLCN